MSIGLAKLRLDGFASIDAGYDGGTITTTPYRLSEATLHVNAKCDHGDLSAELLDEAYQPLRGYSKETQYHSSQTQPQARSAGMAMAATAHWPR